MGAFGDGPVRRYEVTGIVRFGTVDSLGSATITVFDLPTAQRLFDKRGKLDLIRVSADDGVTTPELLGQIRPLLSETTQVKSPPSRRAPIRATPSRGWTSSSTSCSASAAWRCSWAAS